MITRHANINDLAQIVTIYNQTVASRMVTADTTEQTVSDKLPWFESHSVTRPIYVIESDNKVVAWLSFKSFYGRPAYDGTVEIAIYVDEKERGKKLGQKLLNFAISLSPELGISNLLAFIFSHNIPSIQLFEKHGFVQWGLLPEVAIMDNAAYSLTILGKKI